ncbi:MAG TPA: patatin-like phospholipase family protein [Paracoccaceae bacterium]|nr:patatin-like phospholipase family protein [Paracoccaceae bacterium]
MAAIHREKRVNLALQGGGAHGAFTWGALDRLLEEERLDFDGISGTSAGAMNAAMLKTGWMTGGHAGARAQLDRFWGEIRARAQRQANPWTQMAGWFWRDTPWAAAALSQNPLSMMQQALSRHFSPYEWNPLNLNPLRDLLVEMTDFDEVCRASPPTLFICATNVRTGKIRVFSGQDISVDAILASAALPQLFQAVQIGDDHFWDGGFMGNPPLYPLFYGTDARDVVIIHVNPIERPGLPRTAAEIENRVNEISFNSSLMRELRAIAFVKRLIADGRLAPGEMRDVLIHSIRDDETMAGLDAGSKLAPEPRLFDELKAHGRRAADAFLRAHWGSLGREGTVDLHALMD